MIPDDELDELDRIERYLADQLSATEKNQFEDKLHHDPSFAMKVESTRQLMRMIQTANAEKRAQDTLRKLYQQRPVIARQLPVYYRWALGAIAACLAGLLYLAFSTVQLPIVEDDLLVVKNPSNLDKRTEATAYSRLLAGQQALKNENYLQAASHMEAVLKSNDMRSYYQEAAGWSLTVAYLYSNQPHRAETTYQQLRQIDNREYHVSWVERWKIYVQIRLRTRW